MVRKVSKLKALPMPPERVLNGSPTYWANKLRTMTIETRAKYGRDYRPLTPELLEEFLYLYAETGMPQHVCNALGIRRAEVELLEKEDAEFAECFYSAKKAFVEKLEAVGFHRAIEGVPEFAVNDEGKVFERIRRYSEVQHNNLLKRHAPEHYRDNVTILPVNNAVNLNAQLNLKEMTDEQLELLKKIAQTNILEQESGRKE